MTDAVPDANDVAVPAPRPESGLAFRRANYDLGSVALGPIPEGDHASGLADGLAAIDPWRRLHEPEIMLGKYIRRNDPSARRHGIWMDGALCGLVCVREPWMFGPYLETLGLLPQFQGQGIGSTVMDWFEREAPQGSINLWILCSTFNTPALAFYARHGYAEAAILPGVAAPDLVQVLLRKPVASTA